MFKLLIACFTAAVFLFGGTSALAGGSSSTVAYLTPYDGITVNLSGAWNGDCEVKSDPRCIFLANQEPESDRVPLILTVLPLVTKTVAERVDQYNRWIIPLLTKECDPKQNRTQQIRKDSPITIPAGHFQQDGHSNPEVTMVRTVHRIECVTKTGERRSHEQMTDLYLVTGTNAVLGITASLPPNPSEPQLADLNELVLGVISGIKK